MSIVRELRAKFTADTKDFIKGFRDARTEATRLGPSVQEAGIDVQKSYTEIIKAAEKLERSLKDSADGDSFDELNRAIQKSKDEVQTMGRVSEATLSELNQAVQTSSTRLDSLGSGAADNMEEIEAAIDAVNQELQSLGGVTNLDQLDGSVHTSTNRLEDLQEAAGEADQQVANLGGESNLDDLNGSLDDAQGNISDLGDAASDADQEVSTLGEGNNLNDLNGELENAGNNLGDLENAAGDADQEVSNLGGNNNLNELNGDLNNAGGNLDDLQDAANNADQDLSSLGGDTDLNNLNGDLNNAENNLEDLENSLDDVGDATNQAEHDMNDFGDAAEREAGNAESSFGKMGKALGAISGILIGAFAIDGIKEMGEDLAATAGSAQAINAQFSAVFGDLESVATEKLGAIGAEATILEERMKGTFTQIAAFAKTGGMDTADALDLANRSMIAITDSAAFYDRSLEDTAESLQSFLKGNYENDAALGLSATETTRNAAANELYGKSFSKLSEQQKQLALLQMVEDANKVSGALGQASRESEGWENVTGNMSQAWENFKAQIGGPALSIAVQGLKGLTAALTSVDGEKLISGVGKAVDFVTKSVGRLKDGFGALKDFLSGDESAESILQSYGLNPDEWQFAIQAAKTMQEALSKIWKEVQIGKDKVLAVFALFKNEDGTAISILHRLGMKPEQIQQVMDKVQAIQDEFASIGKALEPAKEAIKAVFSLIINQDGTAISILSKLGLNPEQIQRIMDSVDKVKSTISGFFTGLISIIQLNAQNLASRWSMITDGAVAVFNYLLPIIQPALQAVFDFASGIIGKVAAFWKSDGEQIVQAVQNLGKVIGVIFYGIFQVIQFIMPAVLAIIKSVWGNVKGVITGALDIIMGVVKIFSGLFTGDFSKMWEGVKQLFMGAVNFIWNFVQLTFYGKILGGAKVFIGLFKSGFAAMWSGIKSLFGGSISGLIKGFKDGWRILSQTTKDAFRIIYNFLKDTFNSIKSISTGLLTGAKKIFKDGWRILSDNTKTVFNGIYSFFKTVFGLIRDLLTGRITNLKNNFRDGWNWISQKTKDVFNGIYTFFKDVFGKIRDSISGIIGRIKSNLSGTWSDIKRNVSDSFKSVYNTIKGRFDDIVNAAKNLPKRIGDGIGAMASKVSEGVTKVINKLASVLGKGVNGVIGGVNWVLDKIGVDKDIPKWPVPQYAQGTKHKRGPNGTHPGGPMIVGDGKGSNSGPELIETPDGKQMLSPSKPTLMFGEEGTKVWSATETKKILEMIPHYAWGDIKDGIRAAGDWAVGKYESGKKVVKSVGKKIKDTALNVFDYVKNPKGLLDLALKTLGIIKPDESGFAGDMARGAWNKTKEGAIDFVKDKLKDFGLSDSGISVGGGTSGNFGAPFRLTSKPGPRNTGIPGASTFHKGWDWAAPIGTPIPSVTDGTGYRVGWHPLSGNFVEVKDSKGRVHRYQHNSKNIMKVGQKVKKGQTIALVGNTGVGSGAHLHYEPKGFKAGGEIDSDQIVRVGEDGKKEVIIPLERYRSRAVGLWKKAGAALGMSGDTVSVMYNEMTDVIDLLSDIAARITTVGYEIMSNREVLFAMKALLGNLSVSSDPEPEKEPVKAPVTKEPAKKPVEAPKKTKEQLEKEKKEKTIAAKKKADMIERQRQVAEKEKQRKAKAASIWKQAEAYIKQYGSAAKKYFAVIKEDGDYKNDWVTHLPKSIRNTVMTVGKAYKDINGYADGGIVTSAQLAWIAEGGWAESIISHDPAKRVSQRAIWEQTGEELGFGAVGSESNAKIVSLLEKMLELQAQGHGHNIYLDQDLVGELLADRVTEVQESKQGIRNIFKK